MFASKDTLLTRPSGYTIARSVRLRSSASAYFNRTPASASNRKTYTFSCWAKRGSLSSNQNIVAQGNNEVLFRFNTTDNINFADYTGGSAVWEITSSSVYRDPSAWYHIVFAIDTTQATSSNRVKVWINNSQVTFTGTYPTLNSDTPFNTTNAMLIGNRTGVSQYYDGYLTEINFIDGQALTPSSFGETDSITGVWKAKKYGGTYGTNGFYLNFSDNSSNTATTIGKDYSGNGNNWTPNNISVTSGVTYDSMQDVPTLTSATAANFCTWNPLWKLGGTTAGTWSKDGNLNALADTNASMVVYGTMKLGIGNKIYSEFTMTNVVDNADAIGIVSDMDLTSATTDSGTCVMYRADGQKNVNGTVSAYGSSYTDGDLIGVAVNLSANSVTFYKNNTSQGAITGITATDYLHRMRFNNVAGQQAQCIANWGQRPFSYTPPTGFVALNTYNLPASTITNGAAYMAATLYTGNLTGQSISNTNNGSSFQPDLVWIKSRSAATDHKLTDSVRGVTKALISDSTGAETTDLTGVTAINSDGFTVGASTVYNNTSATYVGWQWKAGGTSSSNTNGSITSTVSAGATQGFSVVTWTGNGSASATVGHGLGVAPSMVIAKERTGTDYWHVWHTTLPNQQLYLNVTNAAVSITSGAPGPTDGGLENMMSSTFGFKTSSGGNVNSVNENGILNVAYCFAAVAGYSAFGSYTGNGSTDGPFVYTGFRPRWVMIKQATVSSRDWIILDTSRNTYNVADLQLLPNTSEAENTTFFSSTAYLDILSNGFKVRNSSVRNNENTATYIYAAFAENPFKNSLAR